jgi:hypothetical protein
LKPLAGPTRVVRSGNPGALIAELIDVLVEHQDVWLKDVRDLMAVLAPYHDVARRLGHEPGEIFETAAAGGPLRLADMVRAFGHRDDIRPDNFGFAVVNTPDGPEYFSTL